MLDWQALIQPYQAVDCYSGDEGYIAWRLATGRNVELLHIRASQPNQGNGGILLRKMLRALAVDPPYHSVLGFALGSRRDSLRFYEKMGFNLVEIDGIYRDDTTVLFHQSYAVLCHNHLEQ